MPHIHLLGETYFSQGVIRYGDYVAKVCAAPVSSSLVELRAQPIPVLDPSALCDLVGTFFADGSGRCAYSGPPTSTSPRVEDASVEWPEQMTPYRMVVTLVVGPQDSSSPARGVHGGDDLPSD